jgi:ATP-binding cassette subfamily C protein
MSLLIRLLRRRRRAVGIILALSVIEAVPVAAMGEFLAQALDHGFLPGRLGVGFSWLGALIGAIVLGAATTRLMPPRLSTVVDPVRDDLVRMVVDTSLHAKGGGGSAGLMEQVEAVRRFVSVLLRTFRRSAMMLVATIIGLIVLSPILALFVAPPLVVALAVFGFMLPRLVARQRAVVSADEAVAHDATGLLHGLRDVIACQAADRAAADMTVVIDRQASAARDLARISALRVLIVAFGAQVPLVVLIGFGPKMIHSGQLSAGALIAAAGYLIVTLQPALRTLIQVAGDSILQLGLLMSRIAGSIVAPTQPAVGAITPAGYALRCSRLTFAYGRNAAPVFRDFDLTLVEGEHLAVVGPSGAGKSTLADLMCGLIRPQRGDVRLDGVPLESWDPALLRSRVALVPAEPYVFAGTVGENVEYSNSGADLVAAADAVDLWPLLDRVGGWDAQVSRSTLTAAERQLIALARAYASPARLVILDQASRHLDEREEKFVEESFRDRAGSLIVIAHRIDSVHRADRILVLDGISAVTGRHEELAETSPLYASLVVEREPATAPSH